jgi:hypothetical protein
LQDRYSLCRQHPHSPTLDAQRQPQSHRPLAGDPDHKSTVFDFSEDLSFGRNLEFLKDFKGIVQADAAGGFDALFRDVDGGEKARKSGGELTQDIDRTSFEGN